MSNSKFMCGQTHDQPMAIARSALISGFVSLIVALVSSLLVTEYRFKRDQERRRKERVREYENNCKSALRNAHRKWIEVRHSGEIPETSEISPSELAQNSDSELLELLDEYVIEIEELASAAPEKHEGGNLSYHMDEISRLYRGSPDPVVQSHYDRWEAMSDEIKSALDSL